MPGVTEILSVVIAAAPESRHDEALLRLTATLEALAPVRFVAGNAGAAAAGAGELLVVWELPQAVLRSRSTGVRLYVPRPASPGALAPSVLRRLRGCKVLCRDAADHVACHRPGLDTFLLEGSCDSPTVAAALLAFCRRPPRTRGPRWPARVAEWLRKRRIVEVPARPARQVPEQPLVSVVTVVRNDAPGLSKTLRSVYTQSRQDFEYLIVDGASTDTTVDLVRRHEAGIERWVSEPDRGPYDAMTKGVRLARGRYVLFMNAGDEFTGETALEAALRHAPADADILYGHHLYLRRSGLCTARPASDLRATYEALRDGRLSPAWSAGIPCHQSTFVARRRLLDPGFDPRLRIAADHALLFRLMADRASAHHTGTCVARYVAGGMSRRMLDRCWSEWEDIALAHARDPQHVRAYYTAARAPRGWARVMRRLQGKLA